jgi:rRNA maturation RNase YbeY
LQLIFTNEHPTEVFTLEEHFKVKLDSVFVQERFQKDVFLSIVFLDDEGLLAINREYLSHDYYTDIITFAIEETDEYLEADIYISLDRVRENAESFSVFFNDELLRVAIHGSLHLCGYKDKTKQEQQEMRKKEDFYLSF